MLVGLDNTSCLVYFIIVVYYTLQINQNAYRNGKHNCSVWASLHEMEKETKERKIKKIEMSLCVHELCHCQCFLCVLNKLVCMPCASVSVVSFNSLCVQSLN